MKKFYEAPVVELTGFSAEDVITTSRVPQITPSNVEDFKTAVTNVYGANGMVDYTSSTGASYNW